MTTLPNIYGGIPECSPTELFYTLLDHPKCRIERIVSFGQSSLEDFWYDQSWDEWVLLIQGSAVLNLDGTKITLSPGDHLMIPAGQKHRVTHTDPNQPTIWLAIHFDRESKCANPTQL